MHHGIEKKVPFEQSVPTRMELGAMAKGLVRSFCWQPSVSRDNGISAPACCIYTGYSEAGVASPGAGLGSQHVSDHKPESSDENSRPRPETH